MLTDNKIKKKIKRCKVNRDSSICAKMYKWIGGQIDGQMGNWIGAWIEEGLERWSEEAYKF